MIGKTIGPYQILAKLGEGGMGEVYRARDTKLNRDVAIKVLPEAFANDTDRLARFTREAQTLASLNHPNIAQIYGIEGTALVMELVEGDDVSTLTARGPLPLADALPIARQIADALEAAHELGIVHRDLKPANVKVRADGTVKVLDFGLAKAMDPAAASSGSAMNSPTITAHATQMGVILGTAAYMAPEQARGKAVDRRADIWAFGVVLYEMLTGRRAFAGDEISDVLAAVLRQDIDWTALPPDTPPRLRRLLERCLDRDVKQRLRDIGEARVEIAKIESGAPDSVSGVMPTAATNIGRVARSARLAWVTVAVLAAGLLGIGIVALQHVPETPPTWGPLRFTIDRPPGASFSNVFVDFALSPDGRHIVYRGVLNGASILWVRSLDSLESRPLTGTEGAAVYPFWSADSRSIGFSSRGKLKRIDRSGGPVVDICDLPSGGFTASGPLGGAWSPDDVILFGGTALWRVSASGGAPVAVTTLDGSRETSHGFPHFLPDGRHFVFGAQGTTGRRIRLGSLDSPSSEVLLDVDARSVMAGYSAGHLLYTRAGILLAHPFDAANRSFSGEPVPVANDVSWAAASGDGVLVLGGATARPITHLTWVNRQGRVQSTVGEPGEYGNVVLSPDERHLGVSLVSDSPRNPDTWVIDLAGQSAPLRLTFDPRTDGAPFWSLSSRLVVFNSNRSGFYNLYSKPASGSGQDELLLESKTHDYMNDWSRDGRTLLYCRLTGPTTGHDLLTLDMATRQSSSFLVTAANEDHATFSPDGRWVAYSSDATGSSEVYVRPFPATGGQYQVSRYGGLQPVWRGDGAELFFLALDGTMMVARVSTIAGFESSVPEALFKTTVAVGANSYRRQYAVARDGQSFLVNTPIVTASQPLFTVLVNWPAAIVR